MNKMILISGDLINAANSKLNEWYIRQLPNKTKKDNLG